MNHIETKKDKKIRWINCTKLIAICAVIVDHTGSILYENRAYAWGSYFSVSLFIILSGITSYYSNQRHEESYLKSIYRKSKKIVLAYLVSVFVYLIVMNHSFDLRLYIQSLAAFNITGPHYFVLLYIQLVVADKLLYRILCICTGKKQILIEIAAMISIITIAILTTNYTNILDVYGGGGRLLGGTYLILYFAGMLVAKYHCFNDQLSRNLIFLVVGIVGYVVIWLHMCHQGLSWDEKLPVQGGFNPPGITLISLAICVLCISAGVFQLLERTKYTEWIVMGLDWLGCHTLYIFLYHRLFLDYFLTKYLPIRNMWVSRIMYFMVMIFGSIAIEVVLVQIKKGFARIIKTEMKQEGVEEK